MSDSDIYMSLQLSRIYEASSAIGIFHENIFVTIELISPYFLDNIAASIHKVIIMRDLDDNSRSYAIDEFPVMEPTAIETYWMKKVDIHRYEREIEFLKLDYDYKVWLNKKQLLIKEGKMKPTDCTDACIERQQALLNYTWYTDKEFLLQIPSTSLTDLEQEMITAIEDYYHTKELLKKETIIVQENGSVTYIKPKL